jgi:hypothetical protein
VAIDPKRATQLGAERPCPKILDLEITITYAELK